jgi:hypothetical protein
MTPYSHIGHLARALFFGHKPHERYFAIMSEYATYLDASGDKDNEMIAIGGFISSVAQWDLFQNEWQEILHGAGVTHFHRKNFTAKKPPFNDPKWEDEVNVCKPFMTALVQTIVRNMRFQILNILRIEDWREANKEYCLKEERWTPYALSCITAMDASFVWCEQRGIPSEHLEVLFESGDNGADDLRYQSNKRFGREPLFKPKLPNEKFPHAKELTPLQAGDLLAGYARAGEIQISALENHDSYQIRKCLEVIIDHVPAHNNGEKWTSQGIKNWAMKDGIRRR